MSMILIFGVGVAVVTILKGVKAIKQKKVGSIKKAVLSSVSTFSLVVIGMLAFIAIKSPVFAAEVTREGVEAGMTIGEGFKYLAAALSTGLATIGTGMAVGSVGSSAIGAVSEDQTILGKTLIFVGMAEGIAIYGMIISILILFS